MRRLALITLAIVAVGCHGSLKEPDAGSGQLTGTGSAGGIGSGGTGGSSSTDGAAGGQIVDVRPPDEPCPLEVPAEPVGDITCQFNIIPPPCRAADFSHIGVRVGSAEIPRDTSDQNGWDYSDVSLRRVTIYGPSCSAVTGGATVTIIFEIILP